MKEQVGSEMSLITEGGSNFPVNENMPVKVGERGGLLKLSSGAHENVLGMGRGFMDTYIKIYLLEELAPQYSLFLQ